MEFRGNKAKVVLGGDDFTNQIFGKDLKFFRKVRGQGWTPNLILEIFNTINSMHGSYASLNGVELTALNKSQAWNLKKGDLLLQIHHDETQRPVLALRKSVCEVEDVEDGDIGPSFRLRKIWPLSVDWGYKSWTQPECISNPEDFCDGSFPILFFGFEVTNCSCYDFIGNHRYEQAAARAREFMAMVECYELASRPSVRRAEEEYGVPLRERKPEKVEALRLEDDPTSCVFLKGDCNFRGAYYPLRSVLLDKSLQGYGGLFDERRNLDRITLLMQELYRSVDNLISAESMDFDADSDQSTAPIFKLFLSPNLTSFSVIDRLRALFNPAYCSEADRKDHWKLYNRMGLMDLFAANLKKDSPEGQALQQMFLANYDILHSDMPGLRHNALDFHFARNSQNQK